LDFGDLVRIKQARPEEADLTDEQLKAAISRDLKVLGIKR